MIAMCSCHSANLKAFTKFLKPKLSPTIFKFQQPLYKLNLHHLLSTFLTSPSIFSQPHQTNKQIIVFFCLLKGLVIAVTNPNIQDPSWVSVWVRTTCICQGGLKNKFEMNHTMNSFTSTKTTTSTSAATSAVATHSLHRFSSTPHRNLPIPRRQQCQENKPKSLKVHAIDAAQPFDYESQISTRFIQSTKLKIAVVGFGNFGQFLAKAFLRQGHTVYAHSRTDYSAAADAIGATFFLDPHDLCEQHPDVIILCTSIISTKQVLLSLPVQRLKRNTLFVDVLSVKEFPRNLFLDLLPAHFDILCTHPMFGPESGKESWRDLAFVFDKVRIGNETSRIVRAERFLDIFKKEGCRMVEMTCAEHDTHAAGSQFITHTMGRVLEKLSLKTTSINTKGYETLLDLVDNTSSDSFDLYYGLFMYNEKAMEELQRLGEAFEELKMQLFGHLHELNRNQLFGNQSGREKPYYSKLKRSGAALPSPPQSSGALPAPSSSNNGAALPAPSSSLAQAPQENVGSRVN